MEARSTRIRAFDALRGFSVVSMVGFHLCYDLVYLEGLDVPWFEPPFQDVWRASISWTFLLVAGIMCSYSRNNALRASRYLAVALAIFLVTSVAGVDTPISYGIIYCMGFSTLMAWLVGKLPFRGGRRAAIALAALLIVAFLLCLDVPRGTVGLAQFAGPYVRIPSWPYETGALSWLGFPAPRFASGDYYPPVPYTLLFASGACLGPCIRGGAVPRWLGRLRCRPLELVGRHALLVYVLHQPLLLLAVGLV